MPHDVKWGSDWLVSAPPEVTEQFLEGLSDHALAALPYLFEFWALPHQLPPVTDWRSWVILGGRGAGKTRAGAEWVRSMVEGSRPLDPGRARRVALVGETYDQVREVMIFGDSGLLACCPPDRRPEWQATRRRLVWPNGAQAQAFSAHDPEALRGPQFDAAWVDEFGCSALDKATNQPNKFLDLMSSESQLPYFSDGRRDDPILLQYYAATLDHWSRSENNPVSEVYGGPMVAMDKAHAWAWDARPWPYFPNNTELWADGESFARGHWLSGRIFAQPLAEVVAEICARSGVTDYDVSELHGIVRGYLVDELSSGRAALQPLMLAHGFEVVERNGRLVFRSRREEEPIRLGTDGFAVHDALEGVLDVVRAPDAELAGRIRLSYVEEGGSYTTRSAEAVFPDDTSRTVSQSNYPLSLTYAEARGAVERWLAESRVARETVRFALPPSRTDLSAGSVIALGDGDLSHYRVDRVEETGARVIDAVRVAGTVYEPSDAVEELPAVPSFQAPVPVFPVFLDLPLMRGNEDPNAPHLAVTAQPWPGQVAVYSGLEDAGYSLEQMVTAPAALGETLTPLHRAVPGVPDRGTALEVRLTSGSLSATSREALLRGANLAAIGDGTPGGWELFQFERAELVAPDTYALSHRLRGQAGTEPEQRDVWPEGSLFVLIGPEVGQIGLGPQELGLPRHYRIGPAARPLDDESYTHLVATFEGRGLRPYRPCQLRTRSVDGDFHVSFQRRTRIDGDRWDLEDVPLSESFERYRIEVRLPGGEVLRRAVRSAPSWIYSRAMWLIDGAPTTFEIAVAQVSERYGPGPFGRMEVNV